MANQFPVPPTSAETLAIATANGQTSFSFDWRANSADQVNVIYRPSNAPERVLVLGVDFSVQGLQNPAGGTVTLLSFSANAGDRLYMYRFTTIDREKSWQNEGDYKADLVNKEQDEIYMIMQENRRDLSHNSTAITNEINDRKTAVEQERQQRIAADNTLASLIGNTGSGNAPLYDTVMAVSIARIHPLVNALRTAGYSNPGDGGDALYIRVASEPTHAGKVQSADGAWWELSPMNYGVSVISFGADPTGASSSTISFNNCSEYCIANSVPIIVPAGIFNLSENVVASGNIEWFVSSGASFTGQGNLPTYGGSNAGYRRPNETMHSVVVGNKNNPVTDIKSGISATLYSAAPPGFGPRASVVGYAEKHTTVNDAGVVGGFFEADDIVGWSNSGGGGSNNFVEGVRAHGVVTSRAENGSAYGVIAAALSGTAKPKYLIGVESDNRKNGGSHAPAPRFLDPSSMSVGFLASCAGEYRSDAAFMVNPYNPQKYATGLHIPSGTVENRAIFIDSDTIAAIEVSGSPSFATMIIPNSAPIRGNNSTNTNQFYLIGVTPTNSIRIGQADAASLILAIPGLGERIVSYGEPDSAGAGYRTLRISN